MATNERVDSIKKTTGMEGDKPMNTNRPAATIVALPRKIAIAAGVLYLITRKITIVLIATITVAALALVLSAAPPVQAAGLTNCVELFGRSGACYESVWANGVQFRMTFAQTAKQFPGATPSDKVDNFYVVAQQTSTPQGTLPFLHDHVVRDVPPQNHGNYSVKLRGIFVLCSEQGIVTGACEPTWASIQGLGILPLATTVNGQTLTSVEPIEAEANSEFIMLIDTGAVLVGTINPGQ
jgi:hypothetical protein